MKKYIIVEFGLPHAADTLPDCSPRNRLAAISRQWEQAHAFDGKSRYRVDVADVPQFGAVSRFLAHTIYNPMLSTNFDTNWSECGEYRKSDLISLVEKGLETDDDCIQQWFGGDDVIKLLETANSWNDTVLAVEAICGAHEADPEVLSYVERVLGAMADDD